MKSPKKGKEELTPFIELTDPTSVTLQNSFLIKNAGPTFDNYHKAILASKRKNTTGGNSAGLALSVTGFGGGPLSGIGLGGHTGLIQDKNTYGKVKDHRPAARDGHSGIIFEGRFVVFGGDRHHMPFNDLHFLHIE